MFKWAHFFGKEETEKTIVSPNERICCHFFLKSGELFYSVEVDHKMVIQLSHLGFLIAGENPLGKGLKLVRNLSRKSNEVFEMPWGEDRYIRDNYNEVAFYLTEKNPPNRIFTLRFRVYNDGVAFRYEIPPQPKFQQITVMDELTEFKVDLNTTAWKIPAYLPDRYEYNYEKCFVHELEGSVHTPLTLRVPSGHYLAIHEAALYNYGSVTLKLGQNRALKTDITPLSDGSRAHVRLPFQTPWRLIMIADSAIGLTTNRDMLCLNDPPAGDFSWVKTIKFLGIWWAMYVGEWTWAPGERHGATTEHAKQYIDAAVRLGISGLLIEGWNEGWEGDWLENGINNSFTASTPDFDLEEVARYARSRHIELVGHHETVGFVDNYEKQLEAAYNLYAANGIHYVKSGYAGSMMMINGRKEYHHSQVGVLHYQRTIELAAKKHIMLNIHEPIKGTGTERTWPNLISREGARGQEYEGGALSPSHACYLPYTRLLSGGMDYTSGIFDLANSVKRMATTLTRQIAYYITIYSGAQMVSDRPFMYEERFPDVYQFIRDVPTSFEKTVPLVGEIGEYYIVARKDRDSENWYIGGVTDETARRVSLSLDFLGEGAYVAEIYADSNDAHFRDNQFGYQISRKTVSKMDHLDIYMAPGGGFAIKLGKV